MTNHDDEYTGIFDDLNPEDFNVATTAIDESACENEGLEGFNAFVATHINAFRIAWLTSKSADVKPIAVLASRTMQRIFTPDAEETLGEYIHRLHREAVRMEAIWIFSARPTLVGAIDPDAADPDSDLGSEENLAKALANGSLSRGAEWFAERREGDENHQRFGIMEESAGKLGEPRQSPDSQGAAYWSLILG